MADFPGATSRSPRSGTPLDTNALRMHAERQGLTPAGPLLLGETRMSSHEIRPGDPEHQARLDLRLLVAEAPEGADQVDLSDDAGCSLAYVGRGERKGIRRRIHPDLSQQQSGRRPKKFTA